MKNKKIWIIGIIIVLIGAFIGWGNFYYTKDRQISRIINNLQDPKVDMSKNVVASTPDMDITSQSLKPLQSYFKEHTKAAKQLNYNLRHNRDNGEIKLVQDGRHFLFLPDINYGFNAIAHKFKLIMLIQV